jgi:hypothetical protein
LSGGGEGQDGQCKGDGLGGEGFHGLILLCSRMAGVARIFYFKSDGKLRACRQCRTKTIRDRTLS